MGRKLLKAFEAETAKIKNEDIRNAVKQLLNKCNDKNVIGAASSSGKYHPQFSLGEGGLIRHTKAVCHFTERFLSMMPQYDGDEWDIPYSAAILHDMCKYTDKEHTNIDHPLLMGNMIRDYANEKFSGFDDIIEQNYAKLIAIADCVKSHMSRWDKDKNGNKIGEPPTKMPHYIVAMADMAAASRHIQIQFDENNNMIYEEKRS